ncbi:MAG: hypothetical protein K6A39_01215 [Clostridiales bacterium]|nr:hypothetical protein [Clostridiales bacterium]
MAYTALEEMRRVNMVRFGQDLGPMQPVLYRGENDNDLKSAALRFLHERCEGLLFSREMEEAEAKAGTYLGKSLSANQIPYNMQMDINRLCLERSLEAFVDSGVADDAYTVYYCYLEMFLTRYGNCKKMVELLSEYESNGSSLLMKHRDHYSHSVYVFTLGLALYETNAHFREVFKKYYGFDSRNADQDCQAANLFLEYWGLTALFHDIGYPFELPFEQVLSYFEVDHKERGQGSLFLAYHSLESLTGLSEAAVSRFESIYGRRFDTVTDLLAFDITEKLGKAYGFDEPYMADVVRSKPVSPERFGYFMDHAVFSAARLYKELAEEIGPERLTRFHVDALSAILLHNSLFKFSISFYKDKAKRKQPLKADLHPLAYLLMICDELQCWDRTAYGRNSRTELQPMAATFDFSDNAISAVYHYDCEEQEKIDLFSAEYRRWEEGGEQGKPPRLKAYSDMAEKEQRFTTDIEKIVDTSIMPLSIVPDTCAADRSRKHTYLSSSNFLHLYDFAVAIHGRNEPPETAAEVLERKFQSLSLEYQLSVINRAKSFSRDLDAIGCFFTDRPVDYEMVTAFKPEQVAVFAPMEHERWIREHSEMGWRYGDDYESVPMEAYMPFGDEKEARRALREQMRRHKLMLSGDLTSERIRAHYFTLHKEEREKDWKPFNSMLYLLKKFDGLRIYQLS